MRVLLSLLLVVGQTNAQSRAIQYEVEAWGLGSTSKRTPFWLVANQYGTAPAQAPTLGVNGQIKVDYRNDSTTKRHWNWGGGAVLNSYVGASSALIIPELFVKARYKKIEIWAGRRRQTFGLMDSSLTSGSYSWSGNALPIPKIEIIVPDFVPVPFTKNLLAVKGSYAHGWFGSGTFILHSFLHQKSLYLRFGKPSWPVKIHGGFNHQVVWGGKTSFNYLDSNLINGDKFPSNLGSYLSVITGLKNLSGPQSINDFDFTNRIGNHLGTIDIGVEIEMKRHKLLVYRQSIFEDGSLYYLINVADGLNGVSLQNLYPEPRKGKVIFKKFLFEFLYTLSQGGPEFIIGDPSRRGLDNYFNHQQFRDGWTYQGRIIGTPFITNQADTKRKEPYNGFELVNNNRVRVYHLGAEGFVGNHIQFLTKLSYSHNYGNYNFTYPTVPRQWSGLLQMSGDLPWLKGTKWTAATAFDYGGLYQDTLALRIGLKKTWN